MARGQTVEDILAALPPTTKAERVRYWFDDDLSSLSTLQQLQGEQQIDAASLIEGLHTLHFQIEDEHGAVCSPRSEVFLKFDTETTVTRAAKLRYWFDDLQSVSTVAAASGLQQIDASSLIEGLHTLHFQIEDEHGAVCSARSEVFLKFSHVTGTGNVQAKNLLYWFDDAADGAVSLPMTAGVQQIDASTLVEGLHTLHYQVVCSDGSLTSAYSSVFLKINFEMAQSKAQRLRYWFDNLAAAQETDVLKGTMLLDASTLVEGLHTLHYQLVDETGAVCSPQSGVFLKMNVDVSQPLAKTQRYWFDDDLSTLREQPVTGGTQLLEVDGLLTGLHTLHYQLTDETGKLTSPRSAVFVKMPEWTIPEGENKITQYMYWTNDYSQDNVKVALPQPASPYQLLTLLPTVTAPIRSSMFHFEVTDGQPTIYAKNDIHVRFFDAAGYWSDDARSFIDYAVSETLDDITELQTSQSFERPAENCIKWFSLQAEKGDTIAFRSSQATSLQVFSPTGKEVYAASADKSVKFGGCHTWEDGKYYVAVHDVTGTRQNVTLDYMHMDRYDVVAQDVYTVGNGGASTITYQGNGLTNLYAVALYNEQGDSIHSAHIEYMNDAFASVMFDFTDAQPASYKSKFIFTDESKLFDSELLVEAAKDIKLSIDVDAPSNYLRGGTTTFSITLQNSGNSTAYMVPLAIQVVAEGGCRNVTYAKFSDNISGIETEWLDTELYPKEVIDSISLFVAEQGDLLHFFNVQDAETGISYKYGYFGVNIAPNSNLTITLTLKSNTPVIVRATIPSDWKFYSSDDMDVPSAIARSLSIKSSVKDNICCAREHVECLMNIVVSAFDFMSIFGANWSIADCIASVGNLGLQFAYDVWCGEDYGGKNAKKEIKDKDFVVSAVNTILSCLPADFDKYNLVWIYEHIYDVIHTIWDCVDSFEELPNCPPNPDTDRKKSTPVNSFDPNDIYGYTAESGSRFMTDKVQQVNYRIEFENDTTFATASAHVVEIKDTLNAKQFDLNSYAPTGIKIGDRTEMLDGKPQFVRTIDMRPQINAIAQVEGFYDKMKGIITYRFTSIDPMTMEPTDDVMQGFLPVNYDGTSGIGEVSYNVNLLKAFDDGTQVSNRASIVFDTNEAILTPVWTNTIDAVCPEGRVTEAVLVNDSTATIRCEGSDERSGVWKYEVYVQYGSGELWEKAGECPADSAVVSFRVYDAMDYGFCALAVDSAGNVEVKEMAREASLATFLPGDANADGTVDIEDVVKAMNYFLGTDTALFLKAADVTQDGVVDIEDVVGIGKIYLTQASRIGPRLAPGQVRRQRLRQVQTNPYELKNQ